MKDQYYIGIMSGTSFDGVDAVITQFAGNQLEIIAHHSSPFSQDIKNKLFTLSNASVPHYLEEVYTLDVELGSLYASTVQTLLESKNLSKQSIIAIGCHGQTIRHFPNPSQGFTAQIGDPNILAAQTGITTVADFRRGDLAHGGKGAPLAPAFHHYFFHSPQENRAIVNIGGFANITLLPSSGGVTGFDTGPGNCFIDSFAQLHLKQPFDHQGAWAASGKVNTPLLNALLSHSFFSKTPPKSTGRDEFSISWLHSILDEFPNLAHEDIQATLTEFTALPIAQAIAQKNIQTVYLCGGGAFNDHLRRRIAYYLPDVHLTTTQDIGMHPQLMESCLMAWLAQCTMNKTPLDLGQITGSRKPVLLGGVYYAQLS